MAITLIQSKSANGSGTAPTLNFTSTPTQGNQLIAVVYGQTTTDPANVTMTSSGWTPWTATGLTTNSVASSKLFYKIAGVSEGTVVTGATTPTGGWNISAFEFSNVDTADKVATTPDSGTATKTVSSGTTATTTTANELCFAYAQQAATNGGSVNWTNSFADVEQSSRLIQSYLVVSSAAAYSTIGSWATSRKAAGCIVTFYKASDLGGQIKNNFLTMMGVGS